MKKGIIYIICTIFVYTLLFSINVSELTSMKTYPLKTDILIEKNLNNDLYYRELTDSQKEIYLKILVCAENFQSIIELDKECNRKDLLRAVHAFCYEHPEYYWINPPLLYYRINDDFHIIRIDFNSDETVDERKLTFNELNSFADNIISNITTDLDDFEVIREIHDYLLDHVTYNKNAEDTWDIRSTLLNGEGVCTGYARAFQFLLQKAGYECYFIRGIALDSDHAWNLVKCNDHYYWIDSTWDDRNIKIYKYFLVGNSFFYDHRLNNSEFDILGGHIY